MSIEPSHRVVDVPTGVGRGTLRIIQHMGPTGKLECVSLAIGTGGLDGTPFQRPPWGEPLLRLPASVIGPLRESLGGLEAAR